MTPQIQNPTQISQPTPPPVRKQLLIRNAPENEERAIVPAAPLTPVEIATPAPAPTILTTPTPPVNFLSELNSELAKAKNDPRLHDLLFILGLPDSDPLQNIYVLSVLHTAGPELGYGKLAQLLEKSQGDVENVKTKDLLAFTHRVITDKGTLIEPSSNRTLAVYYSKGKLRIDFYEKVKDGVRLHHSEWTLKPTGKLSSSDSPTLFKGETNAEDSYSKHYKASVLPFLLPFMSFFESLLDLLWSAALFLFAGKRFTRPTLNFHFARLHFAGIPNELALKIEASA